MDRRAVLVTKHGKEVVLGPIFGQFGWKLDLIVADTDQLGTFSGDVPRLHSPIETVRRKALLGASVADTPWLVASEGSIHSTLIGVTEDVEIVALVERQGSRIFVGRALGHGVPAIKFRVDRTSTNEEVIRRCAIAGLPQHHLLVVSDDHQTPSIGALASGEEVLESCRRLLRRSHSLTVQTDLRAHLCPTRREVIADAARDLMVRLLQHCPQCREPGFGDSGTIPGLPCGLCGLPTEEAKARRWSCPSCGYREDQPAAEAAADPGRCQWCNP